MKRLTDCPHSSVREQRRWCASVVDDGTRMSLDVIADVPCVAFALDGKQWGTQTSRPDGVVVFEHDPAGGIVFVELKGKVDPEDPHKPFDQIRAGVEHFSNTETHGREHHDQWAHRDDLPRAAAGRKQAPLALGGEHITFGAVVVSRGGTRIRPQTFECGGRRCMIIVVQKHGGRGSRALELTDLLEQAGLG